MTIDDLQKAELITWPVLGGALGAGLGAYAGASEEEKAKGVKARGRLASAARGAAWGAGLGGSLSGLRSMGFKAGNPYR